LLLRIKITRMFVQIRTLICKYNHYALNVQSTSNANSNTVFTEKILGCATICRTVETFPSLHKQSMF